jgi:uncharacterized protein YodC (DUF2158 family)
MSQYFEGKIGKYMLSEINSGMFSSSQEILDNTLEEKTNIVDFNIGDLVHLKSGGPNMTVKSVDSDNDKVLCQWFIGNSLHQKHFPGESLVNLSDKGKNVSHAMGITFDRFRRTLAYGGRIIFLTPHETLIIELFVNQPGIVFTHSEIVLLVENKPMANNDAAEISRTLICRLIGKMKFIPGAMNWIQSVRGTGYIFVKE